MKYLLSILLLVCGANQTFAQETETSTPTEKPSCDDCAECADEAGVAAAPAVLVAQTKCAISGEELEDRDSYFDYEGHRIYTCCKKCARKVSKKPEQIVLAMYQDGVALENIQTTCAVSGEELEDRDTFVKVYNKTIYTCCKKCARKVKADPSKYLDAMEGRHAQAACPISGKDLDPEESMVIDGMQVDFCCPKCASKAEAAPTDFFAKLHAQNTVVEHASKECLVMPDKPVSRQHFATLGAKRYFFCCEACTLSFAKDPQKYLSAGASQASLESVGADSMGCSDCAAGKDCKDCG